jgi:hypothetical protein
MEVSTSYLYPAEDMCWFVLEHVLAQVTQYQFLAQ